jgi:hypothetical protein
VNVLEHIDKAIELVEQDRKTARLKSRQLDAYWAGFTLQCLSRARNYYENFLN